MSQGITELYLTISVGRDYDGFADEAGIREAFEAGLKLILEQDQIDENDRVENGPIKVPRPGGWLTPGKWSVGW